MPTIKLQITLPELEKYFAGDDEVAVEFRSSIVQEFARRHLKALVTAEAMQSVTALLQAGIKDEVKTQVGERQGRPTIHAVLEFKSVGMAALMTEPGWRGMN